MSESVLTVVDLKRHTDDELIKLIISGDSSAFEEFHSRYLSRVFSIASHMTGSFHDAEEITQEVFNKFHRDLRSFRGDSKLSTWVSRVAINACTDLYRRKQRRPQIQEHQRADDQKAFWAIIENIPGTELDPENLAELNERRHLVRDLCNSLPDEERNILVALYWDEKPKAEVAANLGQSYSTFDARVSRILSKFRKMYENMVS